MELYELIAPCHFGLEAVMKREILDLGYEIERVEDGKVTFLADAEGIAYANLFFRTTERILLKVGQVHAETYDELFEATKALPWEKFIPKNGKFWVTKANSIKSKLFSPSDIQSIMKKAIVERLKQVYYMEWFPEDGAQYPIRVSILKDEVTIGLDTSGVSLHKRGYRKLTAKAPITETLAAALIMLTPWKGDRILVDPFCGSGTFPILHRVSTVLSLRSSGRTSCRKNAGWMRRRMHATGSGTILRQIFRALISTEMSSRVPERTQSWPVWIT